LADGVGGVTGGPLAESFGQPGVRVDAGQLAVLDERGDHRPVVAAFVGAGEQGVLAIEGQGTDRTLDGIAAQIDATIVEEA
jgi:hypothetical protein